MIYRIRHQTIVHYDAPVQLARLNLRLRPAPWPGQWTSDYHLAVDPAPASIESRPGAWPVNVARLEIDSPLCRISIASSFRPGVQGGPPTEPRPDDLTLCAGGAAGRRARDTGPGGRAHFHPTPPHL